MNKKGFTLVELLASIVILALIVAITVPAIDGVSKSIRKTQRENLIKKIEISASDYAFKTNETGVFVDTLIKSGYIEADDNGKYSKEDRIHSIICPMQVSSDDVKFDDMNLWLIDDRLAYHHYLASDKKMNTLPVLETDVDKRMDLAVFDAALSYTADPENITSITIVELKRPMRNDLATEDKDPITQVYDYVTDIKEGKVKKANGRGFGNVQNVAFYCYVIADLTSTLKKSAARAGLIPTQDNEGYFGYNPTVGT